MYEIATLNFQKSMRSTKYPLAFGTRKYVNKFDDYDAFPIRCKKYEPLKKYFCSCIITLLIGVDANVLRIFCVVNLILFFEGGWSKDFS